MKTIGQMFLGLVFLILGGIGGQMIAAMVGGILCAFRSLFKQHFARCGLALIFCLIVYYIALPLLMMAAGSLGDSFGYKMQAAIPVGMVFGFLAGWIWMASGWMMGGSLDGVNLHVTAPSPPVMVFIYQDGQQSEPLPLQEVREQLRAGALGNSTYVCRVGESEWTPLAEAKWLR